LKCEQLHPITPCLLPCAILKAGYSDNPNPNPLDHRNSGPSE